MRYIDLETLTEAIPGLHCPAGVIPNTWCELPAEHPFFAPLPPGKRIGRRGDDVVLLDVEPPTVAQLIDQYTSALDVYFDLVAQSRGWDDRKSCIARAGYGGPYQKEAQAFGAWMDSGYADGYQLMERVVAGEAPMPESPKAFIATLPPFIFPEGGDV